MSSEIFPNVKSVGIFDAKDALTFENVSNSNAEADNFTNVTTTTTSTPPEDQITSLFAYPLVISIITIAITTLVALLALVGNLVVLLAFYLEKPLRENYSNYLIVSLALSDLILGTFCSTQSVWNMTLGYWPFGWLHCQIWDITTITLVMITQTNAFCISIDRYLSVRFPSKYRAWKTQIKMLLVISSVWAFWIGFNIYIRIYWTVDETPDFTIDRPLCTLRIPNMLRMMLYIIVFFFRMLLTVLIYTYLLKAASKFSKRFATSRYSVMPKTAEMSGLNLQELSTAQRDVSMNKSMLKGSLEDHCCSVGGRLTRGHKERLTTRHGDRLTTSNEDGVISGHKDGLTAGHGDSLTFGHGDRCIGMTINGSPCSRGNYYDIDTHDPYKSVKLENGDHEIKRVGNSNGFGFVYTEENTPYSEGTNSIALEDISLMDTNDNSIVSSSNRASTVIATSQAQSSATRGSVEKHMETKGSPIDPLSGRKTVQKEADLRLAQASCVDYPPHPQPTHTEQVLTTRTGSDLLAPTLSLMVPENLGETQERRMRYAARTVFFMLVANAVSYGPIACATVLVVGLDLHMPADLVLLFVTLLYINSCLNPLIYAQVNPLFKATFRRIFRCDCHRNSSAKDTLLQRQERVITSS